MRSHVIAIVTGLTLVLPVAARAQGPGSSPLTLTVEQAIARALADSPRVAEARSLEVAADAGVTMSRAAGRPALNATSGVLRTNHVEEFGVPQANGSVRVIFPDIPNNYRARGEVAVPLYTGGRVAALVSAAEGERRAAQATARVTDADVVLETSVAYWNLATARDRVVVLERGLARADAYLADVRSRVDAGVLPPNDLLSSQAQRARQYVQLIQARNAAAVAEMRLNRAIGLTAGQALVLDSPLDRPASNVGPLASMSVDALVARAHELRPERQALSARHDALESAADAAGRALLPQVTAFAAIEPARPNARFVPRVDEWNTAWDLGVGVTWSLFDGGRARAQRVSNLAQAAAITQRLKDVDAGISVDVRQQLLEVASTRAALEASAEAVAAATEARRVIGERFGVGVAIASEVLDADVALLEAELERSLLLAGLRVTEARIVRAVGGD